MCGDRQPQIQVWLTSVAGPTVDHPHPHFQVRRLCNFKTQPQIQLWLLSATDPTAAPPSSAHQSEVGINRNSKCGYACNSSQFQRPTQIK